MENIEMFRRRQWYKDGKKLSDEELKSCEIGTAYDTLNERAYMAAYDISNEWKREPDWGDVEEGFRIGAKEGIEYCQEKVEKFKKLVKDNILYTDKDTNTLLLQLIEHHLKF